VAAFFYPHRLASLTVACCDKGMANIEEQSSQWQRVTRPTEGGATCFDMHMTIRLRDGRSIDTTQQGFVICYQGQLQVWRNTCPHAGSPMDWIPGQFFSDDGKRLVCHTHGASFDPVSGDCLGGPCDRGLYPLPFRVHADGVDVPIRVSAQ